MTSAACKQRSTTSSPQQLLLGRLLLRAPWSGWLNRRRARWLPLRKGWAKYRMRPFRPYSKPWRVRVRLIAPVTRPHVTRLWPRSSTFLLSSLLRERAKRGIFVCVCFIASTVPTAAQSPTDSGAQLRAFSGTIVLARTVEISPRYNGLLSKINFVPGQFVEQGDLLFEFRTAEQELLLDIDRSKLQRSEAQLGTAELTLKNKQDLRAKKIISETEVLEAQASRDIAAANVATMLPARLKSQSPSLRNLCSCWP